jgi:hypothetical protein
VLLCETRESLDSGQVREAELKVGCALSHGRLEAP